MSQAERTFHSGRPAGRVFRPDEKSRLRRIQRARILTAMVEVCDERGAGNVSVADVVARAGISRRTFYELFEDREDCFLAAFDHALAQAASIVVPAYECEGAWREQVRAGLTTLLGFLDDEPGLGKLLVVDALGAGPRVLQRRTSVLNTLIETVDKGRTQGEPGNTPPLIAEGIVGAVLSVIHAHLLEHAATAGRAQNKRSQNGRSSPSSSSSASSRRTAVGSLSGLLNPLMSMIVTPYLGASTARRELDRSAPKARKTQPQRTNPLRDLNMRLTYRTVRVLLTIANHPGASNRQIGEDAGVHDQGQISKLLGRLHKLGLVQNTAGEGRQANGAPNEWTLTTKGQDIQHAINAQTGATSS